MTFREPSRAGFAHAKGQSRNANVNFAIHTTAPKVFKLIQQSWKPVLKVSTADRNTLVSAGLEARD